VLELKHLAADERFNSGGARAKNVGDLIPQLDEGFARLSLAELGPRLTEADIVWSPLNAPRDVVEDPLALVAGCFVDITDAEGVSYRQPASPARFPGFDDTPGARRHGSASTPARCSPKPATPRPRLTG
jgi:crotonobetainyl-CoA:carnitine CoA-transferase CaiB-like acyl-CoA transferase